MAARHFRAAGAADLRFEVLDELTVVYHRPSGLSHLVTSPMPEMLGVLGKEALTRDTLLERLATAFDVVDASLETLDARLNELVAAGLVEVV